MDLFEELKKTGAVHTAAISIGSVVKIPQVQVIIDGPRDDEISKGMWRGVLVDAPMEKIYCEQEVFLELEDGRCGKIHILRVDPGRAYFKGIGSLAIPRSPEEEEEEILRILDEIKNQKS